MSTARFCRAGQLATADTCNWTAGAAIHSTTTTTNFTETAGSTVILGCETDTDSSIRWNYRSLHSRRPLVVYNGSTIHGTFAWRIKARSCRTNPTQLVHSTPAKLNWTDQQHVDPVTRRVDWSTRVSVTTWLVAPKIGRLVLSQFMRCEHSRWNTSVRKWSLV